jgi:hypothetical protein
MLLKIVFLSLNVALLQGIPVAQVAQEKTGQKNRCGYEIATQKPDTTTQSYKLDPFECSISEYLDPLSKMNLLIPYCIFTVPWYTI